MAGCERHCDCIEHAERETARDYYIRGVSDAAAIIGVDADDLLTQIRQAGEREQKERASDG